MKILFDSPSHKNVFFDDLSEGQMVQANQHVIVSDGEAMVLDPGGHKVYTKLLAQMATVARPAQIKQILFSHQDPDIVASANGWLMMTDATAHLPSLWMRFLPHFGVDDLVVKRVKPIPDQGTNLTLGSCTLKIIPAHFLHSPGNAQLYDPVARILYSGDLGASLGAPYFEVPDFDAHVQYLEGFHRRYMPSSSALKAWARMVRALDVEIVAPQHGAILRGKPMIERFASWLERLEVGPDLLAANCTVP
ncbi:MAG: MBL fold metallo-hydrolase [Myxococcales bacterium]